MTGSYLMVRRPLRPTETCVSTFPERMVTSRGRAALILACCRKASRIPVAEKKRRSEMPNAQRIFAMTKERYHPVPRQANPEAADFRRMGGLRPEFPRADPGLQRLERGPRRF